MPYKSNNVPINNEAYDRRVKLTNEDKNNIIAEYKEGNISIRGLAKKYGVDKRLIQFTLFPERKQHAKKLFAERQKDGRYYDKEKHNEYMKKHRKHKHDLYQEGLIKDKEE